MPLQAHLCRDPHDLLAAEDVDRIHEGAMQVLARTGVTFASERALALLGQAGCQVDEAGGRVRFPAGLVADCLARCPSSFVLRARSRSHDLEIGGRSLYFQSHPGLFLADIDTGERRTATPADIGPLARLLDALDEIHLSIMPTSTVAGRHQAVMLEWIHAEQMRNTQKATAAGVFQGCAPWVIEMARATDQQVYGQINPVSPLSYPAEQIEGGLAYVEAGHPVCILPGPTLGASSPATLAGTLVLQTAEHLAGVVLLQLARPGAPITLAGYPHVLDMRRGALCIGGVEVGLMGAALAQLCRRYGLPSHPEFPLTDSKVLDEQAAAEKAMGLLLVAQAGANLISNGGALEAEKLWSPVQLVIDDELNAMAGRVLEGVRVSEETLAVDLIDQVGPLGTFLNTKHTRNTWRGEQYLPHLADRQPYTAWRDGGSRDITERARERARTLMRDHQVPALPAEQDRELSRILRRAEQAKLS
jgi:trimethylamine---corrinoid protein Co-methyltransferase